MGKKKIVINPKCPWPSCWNPIVLTGQLEKDYPVLKELTDRIIAEDKFFLRHDGKIQVLPIIDRGGFSYYLWCFDCLLTKKSFVGIGEAGKHRCIRNRNDARFWGLNEKKALCDNCLKERGEEMPTRKKYLWREYQKKGLFHIDAWSQSHKTFSLW